MKQNKGFTLIELLAVIVILAIIALIASPVIVGLIDDARKNAAANSAYGVMKAVDNVYGKVLLASANGLPDDLIYTFSTSAPNGYTIGYGTVATTELPVTWDIEEADATLDFNGTKPTGGIITLKKNGSVELTQTLVINGFNCTNSTGQFVCTSGV